ncbi:xylose isomerase-like protein [Mycena floridula]|nr:xylose isomerase-like protein [Mycena floridula]
MPSPKFSIASLSLGSCLYHDLPTKVRVAADVGYSGLEIFIPDFEDFVEQVVEGQHHQLFPSDFPPKSLSNPELEIACAVAITALCEAHNLEISVIQPLRNFEAFLCEKQLQDALDGAERWLRVMSSFKCDLILVCSNHLSQSPISQTYTMKDFMASQVDAFRALGKLAAKYKVRVGYESLAWGTLVNRWDHVWNIVKQVDLPNVGVIVDSFNTLGCQYADPATPSRVRSDTTREEVLENLELMTRTIPMSKLFFYQIADAQRAPQPILDAPDAPRRMTWSRAMRLFPCEPQAPSVSSSAASKSSSDPYFGYLPVVEMTKLIHDAGYSGWWSLEVFNADLNDQDEDCTWRHAKRGLYGLSELWRKTQLWSSSLDLPALVPSEDNSSESDSSLETVDEPLRILPKSRKGSMIESMAPS